MVFKIKFQRNLELSGEETYIFIYLSYLRQVTIQGDIKIHLIDIIQIPDLISIYILEKLGYAYRFQN